MKKLRFYERLLKNKSGLKIRAAALALAVMTVIAPGCGKANTDAPDAPNSGLEDAVSKENKSGEPMTPLTVENLASEAENLANKLIDNGLETTSEEVKTVLLHLNKTSFTEDVYHSLFDADAYEEDPLSVFFKKVTIFNTNCAYDNTPEKIVAFQAFCRNEAGHKVLGKLDACSLAIAEAVCSDAHSIDEDVRANLSPFFGLLDNGSKIEVGGETFFLDDLDDAAKTLLMFSTTSLLNYVKNVCSPERLSEETKDLAVTTHMFANVLCMDACIRVTDYAQP